MFSGRRHAPRLAADDTSALPCRAIADVPSAAKQPSRTRRDLFAWSLLAAAVLLAVLAGPGLVGRVYTRDDLGAFHLPLRAFYARQLARGEPFDWAPQLFSGFYLTGEGQVGTYHPLHWALYRLLPLRAAWSCELVGSYVFMLIGSHLFLRRLLARRDAAMFGALVFTFSGFNLLHFVHPNAIAVAAHVPWLLWMIDVVLVEPDRRRVVAAQAGIAVATGSQLLLGHPQFVWFSLVAEGAYAVCVMAGKRWVIKRYDTSLSGGDETCLARGSAWLAVPWWRIAIAKACGVMLGGVQLLPTLDTLGRSVRRSVDVEFFNYGSLYPLNLVQLVAPYLFTHRVVGQNTHELGVYLGAVPLVLIAWLMARRREWGPFRRPVLTASGLGVLALLLALGEYGPVYRFQRLLPLAGRFRFPCRYTLLVTLCVAVLSAIALAMLARQGERNERTPWRRLTPVWLVVAASVLAAAVGLVLRGSPFTSGIPAVLAGPLLIGSAAVLLVLSLRGRRWALAGLVLFAAADLGYYGLSYAALPYSEPYETYVARARTPPARPGARVVANADLSDPSGLRAGNQITLAGWRRADGYAALEPARRLAYNELPALRAAGVRWVRRSEANAAIAGLVDRNDNWLEVPEPLARVRLVSQTAASDDPARDLGRVPLDSVALVEKPLELPPGVPGTVTVLSERPGRFHLRVDCPTKQLLVVAESYHPGWRAEVDGRSESVVRTNGDFLGCLVGPGEQQVVFEFRPRSLLAGRIVSLAGLIAVCGCIAGEFLLRARKPASLGSG